MLSKKEVKYMLEYISQDRDNSQRKSYVKAAEETLRDFREEYIAKMRKLICADYPALNAKQYEIFGRAIQGCSQISILDDGSVYNGYGYINGKNIRAAYIASQLIDEAIKELEKEREGE